VFRAIFRQDPIEAYHIDGATDELSVKPVEGPFCWVDEQSDDQGGCFAKPRMAKHGPTPRSADATDEIAYRRWFNGQAQVAGWWVHAHNHRHAARLL
jgi:hypothetical protein